MRSLLRSWSRERGGPVDAEADEIARTRDGDEWLEKNMQDKWGDFDIFLYCEAINDIILLDYPLALAPAPPNQACRSTKDLSDDPGRGIKNPPVKYDCCSHVFHIAFYEQVARSPPSHRPPSSSFSRLSWRHREHSGGMSEPEPVNIIIDDAPLFDQSGFSGDSSKYTVISVMSDSLVDGIPSGYNRTHSVTGFGDFGLAGILFSYEGASRAVFHPLKLTGRD
ncbi:hypothetical protein K438DRAFT_2162212 [Mycena galopus ATCC 62051]|nr:hypothetical protein K438DRAFT_2162212 [Mycena galopus ATCC 62051]